MQFHKSQQGIACTIDLIATFGHKKSKDYCKADLRQRILIVFYNNISAGHTRRRLHGMASRNIVIKTINIRCFKSALQ